MTGLIQSLIGPPRCKYCKEPTPPVIASRVGCACIELGLALSNGKYLEALKWVKMGANISQLAIPSNPHTLKTWKVAMAMLSPASRKEAKGPSLDPDDVYQAIDDDNVEILIAFLISGHKIEPETLNTALNRFIKQRNCFNTTSLLGLSREELTKRLNLLMLVQKLAKLKEVGIISSYDIEDINTLLAEINKHKDPANPECLKYYIITALACLEAENGGSVAISHFIKDISKDVLETAISTAREHDQLPQLMTALIANTIENKGDASNLVNAIRTFLSKNDQATITKALELTRSQPDHRVTAAFLNLLGSTPQEISDFFNPQPSSIGHSIQ
ncbi:MAG: hypothetical protein HW387_1200 [Parachlamydiales bacterium]|nr:hypothetical protein [Parachlamydiales bacterium]